MEPNYVRSLTRTFERKIVQSKRESESLFCHRRSRRSESFVQHEIHPRGRLSVKFQMVKETVLNHQFKRKGSAQLDSDSAIKPEHLLKRATFPLEQKKGCDRVDKGVNELSIRTVRRTKSFDQDYSSRHDYKLIKEDIPKNCANDNCGIDISHKLTEQLNQNINLRVSQSSYYEPLGKEEENFCSDLQQRTSSDFPINSTTKDTTFFARLCLDNLINGQTENITYCEEYRDDDFETNDFSTNSFIYEAINGHGLRLNCIGNINEFVEDGQDLNKLEAQLTNRFFDFRATSKKKLNPPHCYVNADGDKLETYTPPTEDSGYCLCTTEEEEEIDGERVYNEIIYNEASDFIDQCSHYELEPGYNEIFSSPTNKVKVLDKPPPLNLATHPKSACSLITEIIKSEEKYIKNLNKLVNYKLEIDRSKHSNISKSLFANLEEIVAYNQEFYERLTKQNTLEAVAHVFIQMGELFKLYPEYIRNVSQAKTCIQDNRDFLEAINKKIIDKIDLEHNLLLPMQRLCVYKQLLENGEQQLKNNNSTSSKLTKAIQLLSKELEIANDDLIIDSIKRCRKDIKTLGNLLAMETFSTIDPIKFEATVFLFPETLLITKLEGDKYLYITHFDVKDLTISASETAKEIVCCDKAKLKNAVQTCHSYIFLAATDQIKHFWLEILNVTIRQYYRASGQQMDVTDNNDYGSDFSSRICIYMERTRMGGILNYCEEQDKNYDNF